MTAPAVSPPCLKTLHFGPQLRGTIVLPPSKSLSARALIISALAGSACQPCNLSPSDDTVALLRALAPADGALTDIGAAGTAMRFLTAYFAATPSDRLLTGTPRMQQRPIGPLVEALRQLGADIAYTGVEGFPPLRVKGRQLAGGAVSIDGSVSSQYVSALLMAGPVMELGLTLRLTGRVASRPYIGMTLALMRHFGARPELTGDAEIHVPPTGYRAAPYTVEPDWSAASYWYEMVALCPDAEARLLLAGLSRDSLQGDARVAHYFRELGVASEFTPEGVVLRKATPADGPLEWHLADEPDLAQTLVVACTLLGRTFRFTGLESLRIKETDRLSALCTELSGLGFSLGTDGQGALWSQPQPAEQATRRQPRSPIATYQDHRMAMAFAPCAYRFPGLQVAHPEVVSKSYPGFWEALRPFEAP